MNRTYTILLFLIFTALAVSSFAQSERDLVKDGNRMYGEKKYSDAEVNYKKSLNVKKDSKYGHFNLGDAYYKQEKYEDAIKEFTPQSANKNLSKSELQQLNHNLGNAYLQSKKYEESIKEYKKALKLNPKDEDTRYNLAYAQAMLKKDQQQQQNKQNQKQDQKEDKKQDQQKQPQDQKDQQKQESDKQPQQQKQKISQEDAEKILRSLNNDEKKVQKKMQKKDEKKTKLEKNW